MKFLEIVVFGALALGASAGEITMREELVAQADGVRLYTRAVVPPGGGKFPCVFERTPYPQREELEVPYPRDCATNDVFAQRGYVHVVQHCRGFGRSEGFCRVYEERADGLATLDWIRRQDWYGGEVFLVGASYTTSVHLTYLSAEPPDVKGAVFEIQTDRMYYRNYCNGCNWQFCNLNWWRYMLSREFPEAKKFEEAVKRPYRDIARRAFGRDVPRYTGQLLHTENGAFWTDDRTDVMNHIRFPVLWQEGLYDFYIEGMTSMWERMLPEAKSKSAFVLRPGGHGNLSLVGTPLERGSAAPRGVTAVDFFDALRHGTPEAVVPVGKVLYHSIGAGEWRTNEWPRTSRALTLRFRSDGRRWTYDPNGPRIPGLAEGVSQRSWDAGSRTDATEFVSTPFAARTSFFGCPRLRVPVRSDCEDTQFFFRLDLVTPGGDAYNLCQTITSLRHANPAARPGEKVLLDLALPLTAFTVDPGWSVRLDVCSDGGVYVQHANVAKPWAEVLDDEVRTAHNEIPPGELTLDLPLE